MLSTPPLTEPGTPRAPQPINKAAPPHRPDSCMWIHDLHVVLLIKTPQIYFGRVAKMSASNLCRQRRLRIHALETVKFAMSSTTIMAQGDRFEAQGKCLCERKHHGGSHLEGLCLCHIQWLRCHSVPAGALKVGAAQNGPLQVGFAQEWRLTGLRCKMASSRFNKL